MASTSQIKGIEEAVFDLEEMITVTEAMAMSGYTRPTIISWCRKHHIGRRVANGPWKIYPKRLKLLLSSELQSGDI